MADGLGPIDEMMGIMLETWEQRYVFKHDRKNGFAVFIREPTQIRVEEAEGGSLRVIYERAANRRTEELRSPKEAAALVESVLFQNSGFKPPGPPIAPRPQAISPWWKRILRI